MMIKKSTEFDYLFIYAIGGRSSASHIFFAEDNLHIQLYTEFGSDIAICVFGLASKPIFRLSSSDHRLGALTTSLVVAGVAPEARTSMGDIGT